MDVHKLQADARTATGKGPARKARAAGMIPGVVYGGDAEPKAINLDPRALRRLKSLPLGWNTPLGLEIEGGEDEALVVLTAVQKHPVNGSLVHADFIRVIEGTPVTVRVPVKLSGRAKGITLGGRVSLTLPEVDLVCLPKDIPAEVAVDVTPLDIGDKILLQKLPLPDGLKVASRHNPPVVACVGKRGARKAAEEAEAGAAAEA